jgi:hypothetical protein
VSIELSWDNKEKTVLCHTYKGQWTVAELHNAIDESRELLLEVGYPVDLIIDMRESGGPPKGVLPAYRYADKKVPDNQRLVVMVEAGKVMQAFNRVIDDIAPVTSSQRYTVNTMEEARELIAEYAASV